MTSSPVTSASATMSYDHSLTMVTWLVHFNHIDVTSSSTMMSFNDDCFMGRMIDWFHNNMRLNNGLNNDMGLVHRLLFNNDLRLLLVDGLLLVDRLLLVNGLLLIDGLLLLVWVSNDDFLLHVDIEDVLGFNEYLASDIAIVEDVELLCY